MKRFRLLYLPLLLALLALAACSWSFPASPTQTPTANPILTGVAQTLTALASPSATSTTASALTATFDLTATFPAMDPQQFMYFYFGNINARNYTLTWSLLTYSFKNRLSGSFQVYTDYWNSVKQVTVKSAFYTCSGDLCAVSATLQLEYTSGQVTSDTYPYTLTRDYNRNTWLFDYIPTPANTSTRIVTATRTPTRTRTTTPTKTRTPTASRTPTITMTPTRTGTFTITQTPTTSFTPTTTRTPTPSDTPTITLTPTPSDTPTWTLTPTETATETATTGP